MVDLVDVERGTVGARSRRTLWLVTTVVASALGVVLAIVLAPDGAFREPEAGAVAGLGLTALLFAGSSMHVASSAWFLSRDAVRREARSRRARFVVVPVGLIAGSALAATVLPPGTFEWFLPLFLGWQFFHFQKQNLGIVALADTSGGGPSMSIVERRAIVVAGGAGIAALLARPALLGLSLDLRLGWVFPLCAIVTGIAFVVGFVSAFRARRPPAQQAEHVALLAAALLFFLPVFVFPNPFAAVSGLVLAHGFQYLAIMVFVAAGDADPAQRVTSLAILLNVALVGGLVLFAASHLHDRGPGLRLLYGAFLGVVMAHFVVDAALWRLRDAFPRRFLRERVPYLLPGSASAAAGDGT